LAYLLEGLASSGGQYWWRQDVACGVVYVLDSELLREEEEDKVE
jgi:hypothetical protein